MTQSCQIMNLTQVMNDVAFRANLLALQSAVELAGGAGNGESCELAADEIRSLAKRGARAAADTSQDETRTL